MNALLLYESGISPPELNAIELGIEAVGLQMPAAGGIDLQAERIGEVLPLLNDRQVDAGRVLDEIPSWAQGRMLVVATARDLGHTMLNFTFGMSHAGEGKAIFSTHRLHDSDIAIAGLVTHELGHTVGLVDRNAPNYNRRSRFAGHCANACVMQPVNNRPDMVQAASKMMERPHTSGFCDDCAGALHSVHLSA